MHSLKYMVAILFTAFGTFVFAATADAAQIGIGTEQKIVQNPLELERQAIELEPRTERDWVADFPNENGNYQNKCEQCGETFIGYRGRAICFDCYKKS